ncbi:hypothetical protein STVA_46290 [Allostella vacuolata]|nr:hypothetical protein STVA_46290 [Stella vacuolata]
MGKGLGVAAALLSSALGGTAVGATRQLAGSVDPLTLGCLRFAIGAAILLPMALRSGQAWPAGRDRWPVITLGMLFFGLFPVLFNAALALTSAARGALALSTLPLLTMAAAALLGVERLAARKCFGVGIAMAGVAAALAADLSAAPAGAWRGDLLMAAAALCMALYNVWSRPFIRRSAVLPYAATGMAAGALLLLPLSVLGGAPARLAALSATDGLAVAYLGVVCGALVFWLWAEALARTTPTRVAVTVCVNPVSAALFGLVLLDEPVGPALAAGLAAVAAGIALAGTGGDRAR